MSWLLPFCRALHPFRWLWSLVGVVLTLLVLEWLVLGSEDLAAGLATWGQTPLQRLTAVGEKLIEGSSSQIFFRGLGLALLLWVVWAPLAGWIARAEVLASSERQAAETGPTRLVQTRLRSLLAPLPCIALVLLLLLVPTLLAGLLNGILPWGIGAVLAALASPVLMACNLVVVVTLLGSVCCTIMPATIATEGSDVFDALSRGFSYLFQQFLWYLAWQALAVILAGFPIVALLGNLDALAGLDEQPRMLVMLAVAGFSASAFWSLQARLYLKMRLLVDEVDEREIWDGAASAKSAQPETKNEGKDSERPSQPRRATPALPELSIPFVGGLIQAAVTMLAVALAWCTTCEAFAWTGREKAGWIRWGLDGKLIPQAEGVLYQIAKYLTGGVLFVALLLALAAPLMRGVRKSRRKKD